MSSPNQPPPGGDQNQAPAMFITTIVMDTTAFLLVITRLIVRKFVVKGLWWDDWLIVLACIGAWIGAAIDFVVFDYGLGRHRYYLNGPTYNRALYFNYGLWIETFATLVLTKISICLLLYRIPATKMLKRPLLIAIAILVVSHLILILLWILQCLPVNAAWDYTVPGNCFTKEQLVQIITAQSVISAIYDFALAAYPALIIFRVQISLRKKIGLCLLMGLGVVTGACCIVRTAINWQNETWDWTWDSVPNWFWRTLEVKFGIIAACIPAVYPGYKPLRKCLKKWSSSYRRSSSDSEEQSEKARFWLNREKSARATPTNDLLTTSSTSNSNGRGEGLGITALEPSVPVPESAILKTTEFAVSGPDPVLGEQGEVVAWRWAGEKGRHVSVDDRRDLPMMPSSMV